MKVKHHYEKGYRFAFIWSRFDHAFNALLIIYKHVYLDDHLIMMSVYFNHQIIGTCYWKSNFTDHVQCDKYKGNSAAVHGPTTYNHSHVSVYVCSFYLLSRQAVQVDYLLFKKFKVFMRIECQEDRTPYGVVKPLMWVLFTIPHGQHAESLFSYHTPPCHTPLCPIAYLLILYSIGIVYQQHRSQCEVSWSNTIITDKVFFHFVSWSL